MSNVIRRLFGWGASRSRLLRTWSLAPKDWGDTTLRSSSPEPRVVAPKDWIGAAAALWRRMASNLVGGRGAPPPHTAKRLEGSWAYQDMSFQGWMTLAAGTPAQSQQDRHRITIFLDLTTFYESIEHELLISEAKRLGFPAAVLLWVMHAYTGPRILSCPEGTAPAIHATRGLIAGCPAAPALSKVALAAPCQRVLAMRTVVGADLWIDDKSVDCESSSARLAAKNALLVSRALLQELKGAGHLPSLKKSYFVCGSYACEKELRRMLTPEDIRIHRIGKDLGVPTTGARRRSTAGQKERLQKGMRRNNKLHALKVGPGKARARLFLLRSSPQASGVTRDRG